MNTKDVLHELRTKNGLSQDDLAAKVFVTRQAVSRWETGLTLSATILSFLNLVVFVVEIECLW